MVVAKPIVCDRISLGRDASHRFDVYFVLEKNTEQEVRLLQFNDILQTGIHLCPAVLLVLGHEIKVDYLMAHLTNSVIKVVVLEAESARRIAVIILWSHVQYAHRLVHNRLALLMPRD